MKYLIICLLTFVISAFPQNFKKVKILINNEFDLKKATELSVDLEEVQFDKSGNFSLFVNDKEFIELQQSGLGYEVLIDDWKAYYNSFPVLTESEKSIVKMGSEMDFGVSGFKFGSMGGYYIFDEIVADLDTMFQLYPNLITEKDSIGFSHEGRTIWAVKISDNPNINEDEPAVGFDALIHAREPQSMATLMYFMWYLLENYGTDPEVTYLVNNREIYCVPCFNPDGYEYNYQQSPGGGYMWRKNKRDNNNNGTFEESQDGVDMNRNFGYKWGYNNSGSSPDPSSSTYRGPSAFSEPEAQAVRDLAILKNYGTHFNMHTHGGYILYPWGYINEETPDSLTYREFAALLTSYSGYAYGYGGQLLGYNSNGSVRDWMYGEQITKNKIFGYTIEIGPSFWPSQSQIFPIAQQNLRTMIYQSFLAGEYVQLENPNFNQEYFVPGDNVDMLPEFKNRGLATAYNLTIELTSPGGLVTVTNGSASIDSIEARSSQTFAFPLSFTITNSVTAGQEVPLALTTYTNGSLLSTDTVTIIIGHPVLVFADTTNDPTELWTITASPSNPKWEATTTTYYSDPTSFTDSKNGSYSNNATVTMTLTDAIDISGYTNPRLNFWTQFNIESNWDYGQVDVSTNNGSSWIPLEGEYTEPGTGSFQPNGEPLYDGVISNWVQEKISLANYLSSEFKVRFQLKSDGGVRADGWYVDDIGILIYTIPTSSEGDVVTVTKYELEQNYPNPFNPSTIIKYAISNKQFVSLKVYDVLGNEIATLINEEKPAGIYEFEFDASELSSGIYYYRLAAGSFIDTKKMILLK